MKVSYSDVFARRDDGSIDYSRLDESRVRQRAREAADAGVPWVIDIEHWPIDIRHDDPAAVAETMAKFVQLIDWAKSERPDVQLGFYMMGPMREYTLPVNIDNLREYLVDHPEFDADGARMAAYMVEYAEWQAANDFLRPLIERVDFVVPSLYTFYNAPDDWVAYAEANIAEARRYGKPVVPFIWPLYHNSNQDYGGQQIGPDFWRLQLDTIRELCDSVVVWGGTNMVVTGSEGWYQATTLFIQDLEDDDAGAPGDVPLP